jgi:hypothetical protein
VFTTLQLTVQECSNLAAAQIEYIDRHIGHCSDAEVQNSGFASRAWINTDEPFRKYRATTY